MVAYRAVGAPATSIDVSVVIPTYRREALLRRCLDAVIVQDFPAERAEIIVVDDGDTPGVDEVVRDAQSVGRMPIRVLRSGNRGPAVARNMGWREARGDVIAFIDDDAFPADRRWLASAYSHFAEPGIDGLSGAVMVPVDGIPTDFQRNVKGLEQGEFLTCNTFYRRSMLERVRGFDERFSVPFREDSDLQYRVAEAGGVLVRDEAVRVVHPAPEGPFAVSLKLQRYAMFNALMYRKHPQRYREKLQRRPPLLYYAIVLLTLLAAVAGVARQSRVAGVAGLLAGLLDLAFFVRRARGVRRTRRDTLDLALTSMLIPPLAVYWRLRGAVQFRVLFF